MISKKDIKQDGSNLIVKCNGVPIDLIDYLSAFDFSRNFTFRKKQMLFTIAIFAMDAFFMNSSFELVNFIFLSSLNLIYIYHIFERRKIHFQFHFENTKEIKFENYQLAPPEAHFYLSSKRSKEEIKYKIFPDNVLNISKDVSRSFFESNFHIPVFKYSKGHAIFFPFFLLVISNREKPVFLNYSHVLKQLTTFTRFSSWLHENKNGTRDRRFKNNMKVYTGDGYFLPIGEDDGLYFFNSYVRYNLDSLSRYSAPLFDKKDKRFLSPQKKKITSPAF